MFDGTANYAVNTLQNFNGVGSYYLKALTGVGDTKYVNVNTKDNWPEEAKATGKYMFITYEQFEEIKQYGIEPICPKCKSSVKNTPIKEDDEQKLSSIYSLMNTIENNVYKV